MFCLSFFAVIVELKNKTNAVDGSDAYFGLNDQERQSQKEQQTTTDIKVAKTLMAKLFGSPKETNGDTGSELSNTSDDPLNLSNSSNSSNPFR